MGQHVEQSDGVLRIDEPPGARAEWAPAAGRAHDGRVDRLTLEALR